MSKCRSDDLMSLEECASEIGRLALENSKLKSSVREHQSALAQKDAEIARLREATDFFLTISKDPNSLIRWFDECVALVEQALTPPTTEESGDTAMRKVDCEGVGDNNGFFEVGGE